MPNTSLSDIQLNIVVNVQNAASIQTLIGTLGQVAARQGTLTQAAQRGTQAVRAQADTYKTLKGRLDAVEGNYDTLYRASYRLMSVGYQLVGAAKSIFSMLTSLTDAWGKFEFMVNRAAGALQVWKTAGNGVNVIYTALIDNLLAATKELRLFPAEDVAKATYFWASTSGQAVRTLGDMKVLMQAINPLMKVAALTQTSYETVIKGTYSILVQYGKALGDTADVTAKLFLVAQRTSLEFNDLVNSFKYVGPTAHALGISFEEVAQVLGALGDAGLRGSQSGRGLRQLFIRLVKPPKEAAAAIDNLFLHTKSLGRSFNELIFPNGKFVGLTKYVGYLAEALKNATVQDRNHFYATVSTANELPVITSLVENQIKVLNGVAGAYDNAKSSVLDSANAAKQFQMSWDLLSGSWQGLIGRLNAGVEVIKIRVGKVMADAMAVAIEKITTFTDKIELWVKRNPEMVEGLTRTAAAIAALAGGAGVLLIVAGSLLGLYAAAAVIVKGFAPLIGIGGAVLSTVLAIGESVVRNWTRIQRTLIPAIRNFIAAITGGKDTLEALQKSWTDLHKTIAGIADFIVKTAVAALTMLFDAMTAIANSPLRPVLEALGRALVTLFAFKTFYAFLKIGLLVKLALDGLVVVIGRFLVPTLIAGNVAAKGFTFSLIGVRAAASALSKVPIIVWLTLLTAAVQYLYDIDFLGIKSKIEGVGKSVDDLKNDMLDFYQQIGTGSKSFEKTINAAVDNLGGYNAQIAVLRVQLADLNSHRSGNQSAYIREGEKIAAIEKQIADLELRAADGADHFRAIVQNVADTTERSVSDVVGNIATMGEKVFGSLSDPKNLENATEFARKYFDTLGSETELTAKKAVTLWNSLTVKPNIRPEEFLKMVVPKAVLEQYGNELSAAVELQNARAALASRDFNLAFRILNGFKIEAASYGDDFNATVANMLSGIPLGISAISEEAVALMDKTPLDMFNALVNGFKGLGDLKKRFAAAVKSSLSAGGLAKLLIGDTTSGTTKKGFESSKLELNLWAQGVLDNVHDQFVLAVAAYTGADKEGELAAAIRKQVGPEHFKQIFYGQFTGTWWKKLTPQQQTTLQEMVDWAAEQIGLVNPSKESVNAVATGLTNKATQLLQAELTKDLPKTPITSDVDPIAELIKGMKNSWTGSGGGKMWVDGMTSYVQSTLKMDLFSGGYSSMKTWVDGIKAYWTGKGSQAVLVKIPHQVGDVYGNSPPKVGPLTHLASGGAWVGKSWADNFMTSSAVAIQSAKNTAGSIRSALSFAGPGSEPMSFESSNQRSLKVQVDVTSKDGSVNNVDMRTLSDALVPNLIRSLEHMASVVN